MFRAITESVTRQATLCLLVLAVLLLPATAQAQDGYQPTSDGSQTFDLGRIAVKVLVDQAILGGGEVEIVEMTFPAGGPRTGGDHRHGRVEIFYVLDGVLEHVVNGVPHELRPGMIGIVRPEDTVAHRVLSDEPVRTLVIWAPGGELQKYLPGNRGSSDEVVLPTASSPPLSPRSNQQSP